MVDGSTSGTSTSRLRWIGGANLPTLGGWRINASELFAELVLDDNTLKLSLRGPLPRLIRAETLSAAPSELSEVFPIRSSFRFRGIGLRRPDGREYYFKTTQTDPILQALQARAFPVSPIVRRPAKLWTLKA
ncbi:hypothetical protein ACIBG5_41695 [Kribbella sp. NPDC050241]|uniref:hypothetical protein n=1 Tax=Kribbella sp. NPDC050241 TaxID=3364115 RepID=UPI0037B50041